MYVLLLPGNLQLLSFVSSGSGELYHCATCYIARVEFFLTTVIPYYCLYYVGLYYIGLHYIGLHISDSLF